MIRRLLNNFRVAFLNNKPDTLSERDDTVAPQVADSTRDNSIQNSTPTSWWRTIFVTSLSVTVLVLGAREFGWLQRWELRAYDQMMLMRPPEAEDDRILLVTVTEKDLQQQKDVLSNETINQVLKKIQSYQPRVIGLHNSLYQKNTQKINLEIEIPKDNIFAGCVFEGINETEAEIPPPPNFTENTGFTDLIPDFDIDDVVRRGLLFSTAFTNSKCNSDYSFATKLAVNYLAQQGIEYNFPDKIFSLNKVPFPRLEKNSGGYINLDRRGSQILINYRNHNNVAKNISFTEVLTDKVNPNVIKNRLVIIGTSARSIDRGLDAPYSISGKKISKVSPVFIHAQITSQLISAVLDNRPLIWYFPEWLEVAWIGVGL